jgi:NADPH:quinone reductase-like Zn-dependent oxidoreductase
MKNLKKTLFCLSNSVDSVLKSLPAKSQSFPNPSSNMPSNTAAWLTAERAIPLELKSSPYTSPKDNEIVVKSGAVAINPVDWAIQAAGSRVPAFSFVTYPCVLGTDVAGEVVEVGKQVSRFKVGDRVVGCGGGALRNKSSEGTFQTYVVIQDYLVSPIPDTMAYEDAAVLPLGLTTAASGLFGNDSLALEYPSISPKTTGKTVVIWGGSTSVGSNAIQLAVASGYEVISTSSPKNFDYVKNLGAAHVFDYNSSTVVSDIIDVLKGADFAGAYAIGSVLSVGNGTAAAEACLEIVDKTDGKKFVAMAMHFAGNLPNGVGAKFVLPISSEVSKVIFEDFLPKALAEGKYVAAPAPMVVGKGLESIQEAFKIQQKGVSAKKVVVSL